MDAPIVLEPKKYTTIQRKLILSRLNKFLYRIIIHDPKPSQEDLTKFWITWPDMSHSGAALFGKIFRMR
jgi:hypothetical protein